MAQCFSYAPMNSSWQSGLSTMVIPLVRLSCTGVLYDVANIALKPSQGATPVAGRTSAFVVRGIFKPQRTQDYTDTVRPQLKSSRQQRPERQQHESGHAIPKTFLSEFLVM